MNMFAPEITVQDPCTQTVDRPLGGIEGLREIRDSVDRLMVTVSPLPMARSLSATYKSLAACYVLVGQGKVYIGQSRQMGKRIVQHASDPKKSFADEVYVIHAQQGGWLFRAAFRGALAYLEDRLTALAKEAGLVEVTNSARVRTWSSEDHAIFGRFVADSLRLLFDAGCRAINATSASQLSAAAEADSGINPVEEGPVLIDAADAPPIGGELALPYVGLWARGYHSEKGFVVLAGSELRTALNPSAPRQRIEELRKRFKGVLMPISGIDDRQRLEAALLFRSAARAAKFLTGAKMGGTKWVRPRYADQILVAE